MLCLIIYQNLPVLFLDQPILSLRVDEELKKNKDKMNLKINEEYVKQISILEMIIIYKRMCCSTSHIKSTLY